MPTAAKLIGAILFAALAWYVSMKVKLVLPGEGAGTDMLAPVNAVIGAIMGWRILGARAGSGFVAGIGYGLTAIFAITFWALLIWSAYEMIERAVAGRYRGPLHALEGMGDLLLGYAALIVTPDVVGTAVIGALICGLVTEYFSHRWS